MKLIFSFDDYSELNYKLMDLIEKYGFVKNTIFYIDAGNSDLRQLQELHRRGFEIGNHTYTHLILKGIAPEAIIKEIKYSNESIKNVTGFYPTKFCWPRGRWDEVSKKIIKKYFKEARTTKIFNYKEPVDLFETNTTIHFSYPRTEYKGKDWLGIAKEYYIKAAIEENGRFEIWGHADEAMEYNEFDNLEKFLKWVKRNK